MKIKRYIAIILLSISVLVLNGCTAVESFKKEIGLRNEYFDYLLDVNMEKLTLQSTRDKGFEVIITDKKAIENMYKLLSKAKVSDTKSELDPDYVFNFYLGDEVEEFYYVIGVEEGNFYNDEISFNVSNRLDEGLIQNLSFVRTPRDFEYVYYNTILGVLEKVKDKISEKNYNVGINIQEDVDCLKYVYSVDLKKFIEDAKKIAPNVDIVNNNEQDFDMVITVKNRGYDSVNFKTKITVNDRVEKITDEYLVIAENKYKEWDIEISKPNGTLDRW